jgi:hypothetical protein
MGRAYSTNKEKRKAYGILLRKTEGRDHQEDQDVDRWRVLKWILDRMEWYGLH